MFPEFYFQQLPYCVIRKNRFPLGGEIVILLTAPFVEMGEQQVDQLPAARSEFCCNVQPVEGHGQDTIILFPEYVIPRFGGPGV